MEQKDWLAMLLSAIAGACSAVVGMFAWFGKKLSSYDTRISKLENAHSAQVEQHKANIRELEGINEELINLDNKQDKQTQTILEALGMRLGMRP